MGGRVQMGAPCAGASLGRRGLPHVDHRDAGATSIKWSVVAIANPGGSEPELPLRRVVHGRVARRPRCVAVGSFVSSRASCSPLIEHWNGKTWAIDAEPGERRARSSSVLDGGVVRRPTSCVAVGSVRSTVKSPTQPLAVRWNGKHWKEVPAARAVGRHELLPQRRVVHEREELLRGR